jgi:hypothetical protein
MKLDVDLFPVNMIALEGKKTLVKIEQAETTRGKNVIVSDELSQRMVKPRNPEAVVWKENVVQK